MRSRLSRNSAQRLSRYGYGIFAINLSDATGENISAVLLGYFLFYGRVADVFVAISTLPVPLVFGTLMTGTADTRFRVGDAILGGFNGMEGIPPFKVGLPSIERTSAFSAQYYSLSSVSSRSD